MFSQLPEFLVNPNPDIYRSSNYVVLDFECTNLEHGSPLNKDNRLVLTAWRDRNGQHYNWKGELDQSELVAACNASDFIVSHNAKFELQWLERCGYDIGSRPVYCTLVAEWVLCGNIRKPLNLDDVLERYGLGHKDPIVSRLIKSGVCPSDIPRSMLLRYGLTDVRLTERLFDRQMGLMHGTRLLPVVYTRCITIPPLADIEKQGLHLDAARVELEYDRTVAAYAEVMEQLEGISEGINPQSPTQLAQLIYGRLGFEEKCDNKGVPIRNKPTKQFPKGLPKTDEATLLSLGAKTDEQRRFIELKKEQGKLSAALNKNLSMFIGACREHDGMIYAELNHGRTVTHRLSSAGRRTYYKMFDDYKGCQFQNLPRQYKPLFSPRHEGWLFGEADGSQLEFRVAGHLGNDDVIRQEVRDGYDVHTFTQEVISRAGKAISRTDAKAHTFKPLYGGTSGTRAEKAYYAAFKDKYNALTTTQDDWCFEVGATKKLETEWGMRFYFPEAEFSRDGWLNCKTNVYNIPVQSFATADIIPIGLTYFWHRTRDAELMLVNTVHDSIEAEFPPHERELFELTAVQSLTHDVYSYLDRVYNVQFSVPLGVGMVIGRHWGELEQNEEEIKINVETPYG